MVNKEMKKMIEDYAALYAQSLLLYGVDISGKLDTAVKMNLALESAYNKGYNKGKEDGLNSSFSWVSCDELLPYNKSDRNKRFSESVLVTYLSCFDDTPISDGIAYYDHDEGGWYWHEDNTPVSVKIIAWASLPEPYKGE